MGAHRLNRRTADERRHLGHAAGALVRAARRLALGLSTARSARGGAIARRGRRVEELRLGRCLAKPRRLLLVVAAEETPKEGALLPSPAAHAHNRAAPWLARRGAGRAAQNAGAGTRRAPPATHHREAPPHIRVPPRRTLGRLLVLLCLVLRLLDDHVVDALGLALAHNLRRRLLAVVMLLMLVHHLLHRLRSAQELQQE